MRFLISFAGLLIVAATATPLSAGEARLQAQQRAEPSSPLERIVTLALDRVPLKAALDAVARQTGVRIAYSRRVVPLDRPVSVQLDAVRVEAALDTLLHGTDVAPTLDRTGQILLVSDRRDGRRDLQTGSISGSVTDAGTGSPLAGATVAVVGTRFAAQADRGGRYSIPAVRPDHCRSRYRLDHRQQRAVVRDRRRPRRAGDGRFGSQGQSAHVARPQRDRVDRRPDRCVRHRDLRRAWCERRGAHHDSTRPARPDPRDAGVERRLRSDLEDDPGAECPAVHAVVERSLRQRRWKPRQRSL